MGNNYFGSNEKGIVRSPVLVVVFSVISCGIYFFYWMYTTANELKIYTGRMDINPGVDLILSILCAPYIIYWFYKYSKIVYEEQVKITQITTDNSLINTILSIFGFGVISAAIMQSDLNNLWTNQKMY